MLEINSKNRGVDLVVKTVFPLSPNGRRETPTPGVISNRSLEQPIQLYSYYGQDAT
jgi:hypothetical protein